MAEVGREPGQPAVEIDALPVPAREAMHGEGVPQIVRAGPDATLGGLELGGTVQSAEGLGRGLDSELPSIPPDEQRVAERCGVSNEGLPCSQIARELDGERRMEWHPAGSSLRLTDEEHPTLKIDIADPQAHGLPEPQARAIEDEQQCTVQGSTECRPVQDTDEAEQQAHLCKREDVRGEPCLSG